MNKILKSAIIASLILITFITAGLVTFFVMFPPEKIKDLAVAQLEPVLGRDIKVDDATVSIFPVLGVALSGFEVSNTQRPGFASDEPFVKMDKFLVQISVASVFKGYPEISAVIFQKPNVLIEMDTAGAYNFDDLALLEKSKTKKGKKKGGAVALPVPLTLNKFQIRDGKINYRDQKESRVVSVGDLSQEIRLSVDKQLKNVKTTGNLELADISLETKKITKPLSDLTFTLSHNICADLTEGTAQVESIRLSLQKIFLNLNGSVSGLNGPNLVFDLAAESDPFDLKDILKEIPVELVPDVAKMTGSGTAKMDVALKGALEEDKPLPVKGSLVINKGMVKYTDLPESVNSINGDIEFTDNSLDVRKLLLRFGENPVSIMASVIDFKEPKVDATVDADINLADVKDLAELPPQTSLSGNLNAHIRAKGKADPADPSKLDVKGDIALQNVSAQIPPLTKPAVARGSMTLTSSSVKNNLAVQIGQSSLKLNAEARNYLSFILKDKKKSLPRPGIQFSITSSLLNTDEFMPAEKKKSQKKETEKSGPVIAPLPGVDVDGRISAKKVVYEKIPMNHFKMDVSVKDDVADVNMSTGLSGGWMKNDLNADLRNVKNVSFRNRLVVSKVEVNELMAAFGRYIKPTTALNRELKKLPQNLFGKVNVSSVLSGNGAKPEDFTQTLSGNMDFKMKEGRIANSLLTKRVAGAVERFLKLDEIHFRDLSAQLRFDDGNAIFDDLKFFSKTAGDWIGKGTVGFNSRLDMAVSNRLPKAASTPLLSLQQKGKNTLNSLLGGTKFSGTASFLNDLGVPADQDGRVTVKLALKGSLSDPKVAFSGFGSAEGGKKKESVQDKAAEELKQKVDQQKAQLEKKLEEKRKKAEEALRRKAQKQRERLEAEKQARKKQLKKEADQLKKKGDELKDKAADKLKDLW
ncbi:MAG: AsmA-like C-terminal region-containing protein [Chitinispirillaceae bacterium]